MSHSGVRGISGWCPKFCTTRGFLWPQQKTLGGKVYAHIKYTATQIHTFTLAKKIYTHLKERMRKLFSSEYCHENVMICGMPHLVFIL